MNRRTALTLVAAMPLALTSCDSVDATIDSVLRDMRVCSAIAQRIVVIISTVTNGNPNAQEQVDNVAGNIASAFEEIRDVLEAHREDISKAPLAVLDSAIARIAANLTDILRLLEVYSAEVKKAVGFAVGTLQMMLLAIAALIPPAQAPMFPRTIIWLNGQNRTLGAIRVEIPTPRHLAAIYNRGVRDFPEARIGRFGFLPF